MSIEDCEIKTCNMLYAKLQYNQTAGLSIDELFDENILKDSKKIKFILEKCSRNGDMSTINFLLSRGITLGILNEEKQTAIHIASFSGHFEVINQLFQHYGTSVNYTDIYSLSHFDVACQSGNLDIVEKFLINGINPNDHYDEQNLWPNHKNTPLQTAVAHYRPELVKLLLKYGANPNLQCSELYGSLPLHLLCHGNLTKNREIIRLLDSTKRIPRIEVLKRMQDSVDKNCELEIAKLLIEYKCDVNIRNRAGDTPMNWIFNHNHFKEIDEIFPFSECEFSIKRQIVHEFRNRQKGMIEFMLSNGANVRVTNNKGDTILHRAIKDMRESRKPPHLDAMHFDDDGLAEMIVKILEHGADVNAKNKLGQSPIQLAFSLLSFKIVKILLEHNADVTDIEIDRFHYIQHIVPCLQATDNLINIIDALKNRGFYIKQSDNLNILKFFVNNCYISLGIANWNDEEISCQIKSLLEFGTDENVILGLNAFWKAAFYNKQIVEMNKSNYIKTLLQIFKHFMILEHGELYTSQKIKNLLSSKVTSLDLHSFFTSEKKLILANLANEIQQMKSTKLSACSSLYDILSTEPQDCCSSIKNWDYRSILSTEDFRMKFPETLGIIEGYFTRTLVRSYFMKSAKDHLNTLLNVQLPNLSCNHILTLLDSCEMILKSIENNKNI